MEPRKSFLIKRGIAFAMFGVVLVQVAPSFADLINQNPDPAPTVSAAPQVSPSAEPSQAASDAPSTAPTAAPAPSGSYTYINASDSPTAEPALADIQDVVLRVPAKFPVDPRATSLHITPINVYSAGDVIVCISTSGSHLWLSNQSQSLLVDGNSSKFLTISGAAAEVNALLNSGQGLRAGGSPRIQGAVIFSRAASVTKPTLNSDLCGDAPRSVNSTVVALGLGMNTVKNPVPLK